MSDNKHLELQVERQAGPEIANMVQVAMQQRAKGLLKYGVSIENSQCSVDELIQHAREEMVDGAVYLGRLHTMHQRELKQARAEAVCNMLRELNEMLDTIADKDPAFGLLAMREFTKSYIEATRCPVVLTMYVQPSVYEAFCERGENLLTLSRNNGFPFNKKVEVRV